MGCAQSNIFNTKENQFYQSKLSELRDRKSIDITNQGLLVLETFSPQDYIHQFDCDLLAKLLSRLNSKKETNLKVTVKQFFNLLISEFDPFNLSISEIADNKRLRLIKLFCDEVLNRSRIAFLRKSNKHELLFIDTDKAYIRIDLYSSTATMRVGLTKKDDLHKTCKNVECKNLTFIDIIDKIIDLNN